MPFSGQLSVISQNFSLVFRSEAFLWISRSFKHCFTHNIVVWSPEIINNNVERTFIMQQKWFYADFVGKCSLSIQIVKMLSIFNLLILKFYILNLCCFMIWPFHTKDRTHTNWPEISYYRIYGAIYAIKSIENWPDRNRIIELPDKQCKLYHKSIGKWPDRNRTVQISDIRCNFIL